MSGKLIAVIDYGAGNLFSVVNALEFLGIRCVITSNAEDLVRADGLILPGVGAFPDAMGALAATGLIPIIREQAVKKPFLGICLGMQMLFSVGFEFARTEGLGLIPGEVHIMRPDGLKIPHMGWNSVTVRGNCPLTEGLSGGEYFYFVHSFAVRTEAEYLALTCDYGGEIPALVARGTVFGAQFHPEKSGAAGLDILQRFEAML